jgi:hypothetical protein
MMRLVDSVVTTAVAAVSSREIVGGTNKDVNLIAATDLEFCKGYEENNEENVP